MRKTMRFLHMLLPRAKDVRFGEDGDTGIVGELDLSDGYDPFHEYERDRRNAPHIALARLEDDPFAALKFIKKWGPLYISEAQPTNGQDHVAIWARSLSHYPYPARDGVPKRIAFKTNVSQFFAQQRAVKELWQLWSAFQSNKIQRLRDLLKARVAEPLPEYEDEPPEGYDYDYSLQQRRMIASALSKRGYEDILIVTARLIHDHFQHYTQGSWLQPCFEVLTDPDADNVQPTGFRMGLHLEHLAEAIYMMIWLDISEKNLAKRCPKCLKLFMPSRRDQGYCTKKCQEAAASKRSYDKRVNRQ
jgi:hypothetical protein